MALQNLLRNKKGGEELLSLWWFFVLAIVGAGIVVGVFIFHSSGVNVKEIESNILSERIYDCLVEEGVLLGEFVGNQDGSFDIFGKCNLKESIFDNRGDFYFEVKFFDKLGQPSLPIVKGNNALKGDCKIQKTEDGEEIKAQYFPRCSFEKRGVIYYSGIEKMFVTGSLEILTVSNQEGKKISIKDD